MPFSQRTIRTRDDIETIIMDQKNPNILEKAVVSNMIGLLGQLNDLSNYAVEIFGDILKQTDMQSKRISDARTRIKSLESTVPAVEKRLVDHAPSYFYDNPYMDKEYARKDRPKGFLFRRDRSTIEVNRRRGLADPPPDLSLMDRFSPDGPCIKLFSDSEFFLNEWLAAEKIRVEEEKRRRKAKKAERKAKKAARKPKDKAAKGGKRKIERVKKKVYSKHGAEYQSDVKQVDDFIEIDERTIPSGQTTYDAVDQGDHGAVGGKRESVKPVAGGGGALKTRTTATATSAHAGPATAGAAVARPAVATTPAVAAAGGARPGPAPAVAAVGVAGAGGPPPTAGIVPGAGGPPPVTAAMGGPPALPPGGGVAVAHPVAVAAVDPMSITLDRSEMTAEMRIAESRRLAAEQAALDEARRQRLEMEKEKAKKAVPMTATASLMAAIRSGGAGLKKVEPVRREIKKDPRTLMLESLRTGGAGLKKVDRAAEDAKRAAAREAEEEDNTIFAALNARRGLLADSDDDDSDYESSGWDED